MQLKSQGLATGWLQGGRGSGILDQGLREACLGEASWSQQQQGE